MSETETCPHCGGTGTVVTFASSTYATTNDGGYYFPATWSNAHSDDKQKPIDTSIFRKWQDKTLTYLYKAAEFVCRIWFVIQRRSDPRWSSKRWKAKT